MRKIPIPAGSLVVLSGVPGSGKSYLLEKSKLAAGVVQSTDRLRTLLAGDSVFYGADGTRVQEPSPVMNALVWTTLLKVVEQRLVQRLTTVVDATLVADRIPGSTGRDDFARLAEKHGVPFKVLILDTSLEDALRQNQMRAARLPDEVMQRFADAFSRTSRHDHELVSSEDVVEIVAPIQLDDAHWDIIGDIHGLLSDLKTFLGKLGYNPDDKGIYRHPENRRMLFLGDLVDRGPNSLGSLAFVQAHVHAGMAHCLMGNHEDKLLRFWDRLQAGDLERWSSLANAQTGMELARMPIKDAQRLVDFMRTLPLMASYEDDSSVVLFGHADARAIHIQRTGKEDLLYGRANWGKFDSDLAMQQFLEKESAFSVNGEPPHKTQYYVRGHIPPTSEQPNVVSLDDHAFNGGTLRALRLESLLTGERTVHQHRVRDFNFREVQKVRTAPYTALQKLVADGMATVKVDKSTGLQLFKYAKKVFYDGLWNASEALTRARGHVYDIAGNLVSNPFDKIFNYKEQDVGLDVADNTPIRAVEKVNGFLGVISPHPMRKGELLIHTTGSFDSDFAGYIRDMLSRDVRANLLKFFSRYPMTCMFEVVHPDDPHVIPYTEDDHGLYLIGARHIEVGSRLLTEETLDTIAQSLGVRRPPHFETTFEALREMNRDCRHEGFMVRALDERETTLFKLKSPFYLTTKFMARMKDGNWKHLYSKPEDFKKKLDEEFFPLVDLVRNSIALDTVLAHDEIGRRDMVQSLVAEMLATYPATDDPIEGEVAYNRCKMSE